LYHQRKTPLKPGRERKVTKQDKRLTRSGDRQSLIGGLVKKTMSVNVNGVRHRLVSYYKEDDVLRGRLETPSLSNELTNIKPRLELTSRQNFQAPIGDTDEVTTGYWP
jgi:hypothetical protein